ncbi:MAG: hypothetical protein ISR95_04880 [Candidatus Marinimicrobia bacterium]|nr:hypothetical protein [Candidatus Neomarinimicrobiota bacterium]
MFQEITLAADFINIYHSNKSDYLRALEYLEKEKTIFVDNCFYRDLDQFLDTVPDEEKSLAKGNIQLFLSGKITSVNPKSSPFTTKEIPDERFRALMSIAAANGDKILIKNDYDEKYELVITLKTNVHVYALMEYLSPDKNCRCTNPRRIKFDDKEELDPSVFLKPYLAISRKLWIQDPYPLTYVRKKDIFSVRPFLIDLFKMCPKGTVVNFYSKSDAERSESDNLCENTIKSKISGISPKHISLVFEFGSVMDRPWNTDQFNIDVGHGIGMFFKNYDKNKYENGAGDNAYITITLRHT